MIKSSALVIFSNGVGQEKIEDEDIHVPLRPMFR